MTTETVTVRDTAQFVEREPRSSFSAFLREVGLVHGEATVTPFADVREVALLDDAAYPSAYSVLHEVALLDDVAYESVRYPVVWREVARLNDRISSKRTAFQTSREVARIFGRVSGNPTGVLREVALLGDAIHWTGRPVVLREVARFSDNVYPHTTFRVREVAQLNDRMSSRTRVNGVLREVALLSDWDYPYYVAVNTVREVARFKSWASPLLVRAWLLHDTFYGSGRAIPPSYGRAYTCSILTWGMSVYVNYPFTTQAGNFAAGQNLWRLDAVKDYNDEIQAWIKTGKLDLGTSHGKRVTNLYAAGSSLEPLNVDVTGDVEGVLSTYTYALDLRDQTDYRNNRATLGKGFRSRYLQFTLGAAKYLAFRLLTAEVDVAMSPRRVG